MRKEARPFRLALVTTGLTYGGAETQVVNLAIAFKRRGWEVMVVTLIPPLAYVEELSENGIPVESLNMSRGVPDPRAIFRLARLLRKWRPSVVHSHMVHANLLARIARPIAGVPVLISTAHNIKEGGKWREWAYRLTEWLCDLTTNVSQAAVERYVRVGAASAHKIEFMPNGVDVDKFAPDDAGRQLARKLHDVESSYVWLAVGRLEPEKNYPLMLEAFSRITTRFPSAVLLIVGQGKLRQELERIAAELGLERHVRFLGVRKDIPLLMKAADAYVLSSDWEGMPIVLLEASASALPCVATRVGGNHEVILHGRSGRLTQPGDAESLAKSMMRLMELPEDARNRMKQAARNHVVDCYDLTLVADRWEIMYRRLMKAKNILPVGEMAMDS
ncbi:glycosyltransferase [Brevibacillus fluminis]|uniref:glycosyltransferase n=1 Tax=Brevibacillus fluminis TaxID=511487 RepID=UPI003F8B1EBE